MKFILILTLVTYVNCIRKGADVGQESRSRRVERTDDGHVQKKAGDHTRNKEGENHDSVKYRQRQQGDYYAEDYDDYYENYYDMDDDIYDDYRRIISPEYDAMDSYSGYSDDSVLLKLKTLIQNKPDAMISVKLHNFTYCVNDKQAEPRKGYGGKFSNFDNLLSSTFPKSFANSQKVIQLFYIVFSVAGESLFDTEGQCSFTFQSQNQNEVINRRTNLVTTNKKATLDVRGKENFRIEFSLGNRQDMISSKDGSELIMFDPELRITSGCFSYRMLVFVKPRGISEGKANKVMSGFSKLMSTPNDVDKFFETHVNLPNFKILTKEISTGSHDDLIFNIFKPFVKETQRNTVQIDFCRASAAMYQRAIKDKGPINEFLYGDIQIPEGGLFAVKDTAGPVMRSLFNEALNMLRDNAQRIAEGGDLRKIRTSIMQSLKQLFQEHRKRTRNNENYHEFENHFGAFQTSMKKKPV